MIDKNSNNELLVKINFLEDKLSEVLNKLNEYESSNSYQIKNIEEQKSDKEAEIIRIHSKKLSILSERINNFIDVTNKDREKLWSNTERLKEMIETSQNMHSINNKMLEIEKKEINRMQEVKGKEMIDYVDKKLEENQLKLDNLISKSLESKVEWNNFVHNAEIKTLDEILKLYRTKDIPQESNINYQQLKKRLENLLEESKKTGEIIEREGTRKISEIAIQNRIDELKKAYFRKTKRKQRESFIPDEVKFFWSKEKEISKIRQSKLPMKNFSIRLNEDYLNRLKIIAEKTGNNRNDLIRDAIEKALERWEDLDDDDLIS